MSLDGCGGNSDAVCYVHTWGQDFFSLSSKTVGTFFLYLSGASIYGGESIVYTPNLGTDVLGAASSRSSEKTKWDFARLSALPRMRGEERRGGGGGPRFHEAVEFC